MSRDATKNGTEPDLDIDNYELTDLLGLFGLDVAYDDAGLARAKRIVLKTHPDKSRMDAKFFLFYCKAYKILVQLWKFRNVHSDPAATAATAATAAAGGGKREREQMVYVSDTAFDRDTSGNGELLDRLFRENKALNKTHAFNQWFNAEFEKARIDAVDADGHGDWLMEEGDRDSQLGVESTGHMMAAFTEKKRTMCQDVMVHQKVESFYGGLGGGMGSDLCGEDGSGDGAYDSAGHSSGSVAYQDLRKAHTETMIPVSDADFASHKAFGSVDEMRRHRTEQDTAPLSAEESRQQLHDQSTREDESATRRAYRLTKEVEEAEKRSQQFWKNLRMLKDK
jgi:hypothetical protein